MPISADGSSMEWIQLLENDKEQLMGDLAKAVSPENAQRVLEKEMDRLLMQYNEECGEEIPTRYKVGSARSNAGREYLTCSLG